MSDAMLLPRAASASEVPGLLKHVPCNPLNSMCELVRRTASKRRSRMCSEVCVGKKLYSGLPWCVAVLGSSEAALVPVSDESSCC